MKAVISDIHSNLAAISAVLEDIENLGTVEEIICLGDIIGYGPSPCECLDLIMDRMASLMGNHEDALLKGAENFNPKARAAIDWTRNALKILDPGDAGGQKRLKYLNELSVNAEENDRYFVHASPRHPVKEYMIPTDVKRPAKLDANFELFNHICFVGHSHIPCVLVQVEPGKYECYRPDELIGNSYIIDEDEKAMINIGSVGQPRDRNPDSSYVIFDEDIVQFRRVKYDIQQTVDRVLAIPELPNFEGTRLLEGR